MPDAMFFNGTDPLIRIIVVGVCYYFGLIFLLRASGKRTLSRFNAYDMVITMALGSILAKALLNKDVSLSETLTATLLLILLQYALSVAMLRFGWVRKLVSSKPSVLFHEGAFIESALRHERVCKEEVMAAVHEKGIGELELVEAVIMGANGQLSVLLKRQTLEPQTQTVVAASKPFGSLP